MANKKSKGSPEFETGLKRFEEIVKALEDGDLDLDSCLELFEEGVRLSRMCHQKLEQAEQRVQLLLKDASGQVRAVEFETDQDET